MSNEAEQYTIIIMITDKKVKIVATIGPASDSPHMIEALAIEGVDIFRINLSHSSKEYILQIVKDIRIVEKKVSRPLTIMGDLAGPKIRIGDVEEGTHLMTGGKIRIYEKEVMGTSDGFSLNHPSILKDLEKDAEIFIDDGYIKLRAEKHFDGGIVATVLVGGVLKSHKGFSAEGLLLKTTGLSDKDKQDIKIMLAENVDALAVSFVQTASDITAVRNMLPEKSRVMLIAKIETAQGIENADAILNVSDGLMVARGDMGLAIPIAKVPHIQKELINLCLSKAKPVITATQMLESMINNPIPTRAEVTDVANAILDGTDAVMLSAETASGKFPVETVGTMVKIIKEALHHITPRFFEDEDEIPNAVSGVVGELADEVGAKLVIVFTQSGSSAQKISRHRHPQVILALSPDEKTVRNLNFTWGVHPKHIRTISHFDTMREDAIVHAKHNEFHALEKNEPFVIAAGMPFGKAGTTNFVFVEKV